MPERDPGLALVVSTLESVEQARTLTRTLLEERLIACGNIVPAVTSIYWWQGAVEEAAEVLLIMKTRTTLVPRLFARVAEIHPYDIPELVALRPSQVAEAYSRWMLHETTEGIG